MTIDEQPPERVWLYPREAEGKWSVNTTGQGTEYVLADKYEELLEAFNQLSSDYHTMKTYE